MTDIARPHRRRLALVVPEYRTPAYGGGGLAAVADFAIDAFTDPALPEDARWDVRVVSVRTHRNAPQHRRLGAPSTWHRGPVTEERALGPVVVHDVGAHLGEVEPVRYLPRRVLTDLVADRDVALVVAGSPALANVFHGTDVPVVLNVATLVEEERQAALAAGRGPTAAWRRLSTRVVQRLDVRGLRVADEVIALNPGMRDVLAGMTAAPVHLLPFGVDTARFSAPERRAESGPIVMLGRLDDERKNIGGLLEAYRLLRDQHGVTRRLVLAGRNGLRAVDAGRLHALGLHEHVDVLASPEPRVVVELLRSASVFTLASHEEGLGIVLLEAMASGLPVVATDTRGARHVVQDGLTGMLVDTGEGMPERFAAAVALVLGDPACADRMGVAGRAHVEASFSVAATRAQWRAVAQRVAERSVR